MREKEGSRQREEASVGCLLIFFEQERGVIGTDFCTRNIPDRIPVTISKICQR